MGISGTDSALMYSLSAVARAGATRSGYHSALPFVSIAGTARRGNVRAGSMTITDVLDEAPNRCTFTVVGITPTKGQEVIVTLGSENNRQRLFAGHILQVEQIQAAASATVFYRVSAIDYTWLADRRTVTKRYTNQSATTIATDLVSTYTSGFTSAAVASGLDTVDEITFTNETVSAALTRLAKRIGGYWYWDYLKDLHFFVTETGNTPVDLTTAHISANDLSYATDLSQVVTRALIEGYGSTARDEVAVGDTTLAVVDDAFYNAAGGTVVSGPQRITYTGLGFGSILTPLWVSVTNANITTPKWGAAAYSPTLRRFVVVGLATVATSPDGLTWTPRTASWTGQATAMVWAAELSLFVVVTVTGEVETSPDGITWTSQTPAAANTWAGITWAPEIPLLVVVGGSGASRVMTSPDGVTWTAQTAASALSWSAVSWSASLTLFVAVAAQSGATSAMSSPDGVTWTTRIPSDTANAWFAVAWSPTVGKFVAVGTAGGIMYSSDGTSWASIADRSGAATALTGVLWIAEQSRYVAVLYNTTRIFTSTDALIWAEEIIPTGEWGLNGSTSMAYGNGTTIVVADDNSSNAILTANVSDTYPVLTGIPASGTGSVLYAIAAGDDVNILVTVNDAAAQTALAALVGGDGIHEEYLQDRRLSETEATARGEALLALRSTAETSLRYRSRDLRTKAGKTITITIGSPTDLSATMKIQQVTISDFSNSTTLYPTYHVEASSTRFSLEDLLRVARKDT